MAALFLTHRFLTFQQIMTSAVSKSHPISFPELHAYEVWIGLEWGGGWSEPMARHYHFPLTKSALNLSMIRVGVTGETKGSDISSIRDSSG